MAETESTEAALATDGVATTNKNVNLCIARSFGPPSVAQRGAAHVSSTLERRGAAGTARKSQSGMNPGTPAKRQAREGGGDGPWCHVPYAHIDGTLTHGWRGLATAAAESRTPNSSV